MKNIKMINLLIIITLLLTAGIANAQKIAVSSPEQDSEVITQESNITPESNISTEDCADDVCVSDKTDEYVDVEALTNSLGLNVIQKTQSSNLSGLTSDDGTFIATPVTGGAAVCIVPGEPCVSSGTSSFIAQILLYTFKYNMFEMETTITEKIGESNFLISTSNPVSLALIETTLKTFCKEPTTLVTALECQKVRVELSFAEQSEREETQLDKQNLILREMKVDQLEARINATYEDKQGTACDRASSRIGAADALDRAKEQYKKASDETVAYQTLNSETLQSLSGTEETFSENVTGAADARMASNTSSFLMAGDFDVKEGEDDPLENFASVEFDDAGEPIQVEETVEFPGDAGEKDIASLPGANRNYSGIVLDRPVIKTELHKFATDNAIVNLINPIPEETDIGKVLQNGSVDFIKDKSKQARYSIAKDMTNFSKAFRVADGSGSENISKGAQYIVENLKKLKADPIEYEDIGEDISEYQFLDSLVRRIPQSKMYYANTFGDNPENVDKEIVRSLATTLAIKWKQYQILEKMIAARATTLAINVEAEK